MQIIADLHIHSKYSRAVSPAMDLRGIAGSAKKKGINLVATGDWTHPLWFKNIQTELKETSKGIYGLQPGVGNADLRSLQNIRFLLSTEISSIYTQGGKMRRVHNLIFSPSISTCEKIINKLKSHGANLMSDGRPIIGLSSKQLLELVLGIDKDVLFVPAHAWTPWFSIFGSKSGFDSIEECFGQEGAKNIFAVETGLSSDPIMNWQIKDLENRSLISCSDAHSGPKLGREATVFIATMKQGNKEAMEFSYTDIINAIKQTPNGRLKIGYTIEFFPEEGKYHWTGHRACNVRYKPLEVKEKGVVCPVCRQPLTVGVENRVLDLAHKNLTPHDLLFVQNKVGLTFVYDKEKKRRPFVSLVPFLEILTEINNGSNAKALREYDRLITTNSAEFDILLKKPYEEIEKMGGEKLRQAIQIMRERKVFVDPGYDGVFGKVKIFKENETEIIEERKSGNEKQPTLF